MKKVESWIDYFNERAKEFENPSEIGNHYIGDDVVDNGFAESEKERLISYLQPDQNEKIYDLGCGAGFSTHLIGSYFKEAIGIDMGEELLNKGTKHYPQYTFVNDNIVTLSNFEDNSMQYILMYGVLHQMGTETDIAECLNNIARVSKVGARVVIYKIPDKKFYDQYQEYRKQMNAQKGNRNTTVDELKWVWIDEAFIQKHAGSDFEVIINRPCWGSVLPFSAWFDCVLIKK